MAYLSLHCDIIFTLLFNLLQDACFIYFFLDVEIAHKICMLLFEMQFLLSYISLTNCQLHILDMKLFLGKNIKATLSNLIWKSKYLYLSLYNKIVVVVSMVSHHYSTAPRPVSDYVDTAAIDDGP